jgi:hypothetical protein
MANIQESSGGYEYASVDTDPGAGGFFTKPVSIRRKNDDIQKLFFSIRELEDEPSEASVITVVLQFRCKGDVGWTTYTNDGTDFVIGDRKLIDSNAAGVQWRAGVLSDGFTSGSVRFGFDW